jgi:hypothetical protein
MPAGELYMACLSNLAAMVSALEAVLDFGADGDGEVAWLPLAEHSHKAVRIEPEHRDWILIVLPLVRENIMLSRFAPESGAGERSVRPTGRGRVDAPHDG